MQRPQEADTGILERDLRAHGGKPARSGSSREAICVDRLRRPRPLPAEATTRAPSRYQRSKLGLYTNSGIAHVGTVLATEASSDLTASVSTSDPVMMKRPGFMDAISERMTNQMPSHTASCRHLPALYLTLMSPIHGRCHTCHGRCHTCHKIAGDRTIGDVHGQPA